MTRVAAVRERAALEMIFPRVVGYRIDLPEEKLEAKFTPNSKLVLTPDMVGPGQTLLEGIVGEGVTLTVAEMKDKRPSTVSYELAKYLLYSYFKDADGEPKLHLFYQIQRIVRRWIDEGYLECKGGTGPWMLQILSIAAQAAERIYNGIAAAIGDEERIRAVLDPYNPKGSTRHVGFMTSKDLYTTDPAKMPHQLRRLRQRLGGRVCPRRRGTPARPLLRQESGPWPRSSVQGRIDGAFLPAGFHRQHRRRARTRRSPAPDRRGQGLSPRERETQIRDHAPEMDQGREQSWHLWALGVRGIQRCIRDAEGIRRVDRSCG